MKVSMLSGAMLVLLVLTGMLQGDHKATNDDPFPPAEWGPVTNGCRFSVAANQEWYGYEDPIRLRLKFENVGDEPVKIATYGGSSLLIFRFDLRLPDGEPVPLTLQGKREMDAGAYSLRSRTVKPGESQPDDIFPTLARVHDMSLSEEYTLTVYRLDVFGSRKEGEERPKPFEVKSNTIKITVRTVDRWETLQPRKKK
jgi:hypothetical protein